MTGVKKKPVAKERPPTAPSVIDFSTLTPAERVAEKTRLEHERVVAGKSLPSYTDA